MYYNTRSRQKSPVRQQHAWFDTKKSDSTQQCPVRHENALPSVHQLTLLLSNIPPFKRHALSFSFMWKFQSQDQDQDADFSDQLFNKCSEIRHKGPCQGLKNNYVSSKIIYPITTQNNLSRIHNLCTRMLITAWSHWNSFPDNWPTDDTASVGTRPIIGSKSIDNALYNNINMVTHPIHFPCAKVKLSLFKWLLLPKWHIPVMLILHIYILCIYIPTDKWRNSNVIITPKRHRNVSFT